MSIERILVLEDELVVQKNFEQQLRRRNLDVKTASTIAEARQMLREDSIDLLFADLRLPDGDGGKFLAEVAEWPVRPLVVIVTGFATIESAVECMRHGAFDYLIKPFTFDQIDCTISKADDYLRLIRVSHHLSHKDEDSSYELLGQSVAMRRLRDLVRKVAQAKATVLIQGESGTGKELVARSLYRQSSRAGMPFIKLNCAAVPENLIESEFFGHEKGSFTGAQQRREGRFELAHGGTLLLDEISEVTLQAQAKLLRVLQESEFERVGGARTVKVDVRVLASTNRDLRKSVERREFREDLFFRLNVIPIFVPPLRDRPEDIPFLATAFVHRFARKHGVRVAGMSAPALEHLQRRAWPGNVRELQNVIEGAVILSSDGAEIAPCDLDALESHSQSNRGDRRENRGPSATFPTLDELEQRHVLQALRLHQGNKTHAAKALGITARTLRNKLHEYEIKDEP